MKLLWGIFVTAVISTSWGAEVVRVRLHSFNKSVRVSGLGVVAQFNRGSVVPIMIPRLQALKVRLVSVKPIIKWEVSKSKDLGAFVYGGPLQLKGEFLQIDNKWVPSPIYLYPKPQGGIDVIAELDIERYLLGVLPSEMPLSWPMEALKAQAVVARSYALARLDEVQKGQQYHLENNILDQVFKPSEHLQIAPQLKARALRAIRETEGQYLKNKLGSPVKSYYHADCGGRTEVASYVWEGAKGFGTTRDRTCPKSPSGRWRLELTSQQINQALAKYFGPGEVEQISVLSKTPTRRNWLLSVKYKDQPFKKVINSQKLRELLGFMRLKSTHFSVTQHVDRFVFVGLGFGHGVGMCQWGARSQAYQGKSYTSILSHYYPRSRFEDNQLKMTLTAKSRGEKITPLDL